MAKTLSVVITTAALADPETTPLSSGRQSHSFRAYLLRCHILPQLIADPLVGEVIVVGEFEPGAGYAYLDVPSVEHSSIYDSLRKRQVGTDAAQGDWIAVMNDDHVWDRRAIVNAKTYMLYHMCDVISPARWTRLRAVSGERLNGGEPGGRWSGSGHVCGHGAIYRREVLAACPWSAEPKIFSYDVTHSQHIREAGFHILWAEDVKLWDCELGAKPWL